MKKMKKKFDCVEMMHRGALAIYREIGSMTLDEQIAWWKKQNDLFQAHTPARRKAKRKTADPRG